MLRLVALVLLWPALAWADPATLAALYTAASAVAATVTVGGVIAVASIAANVYGASKQRRKARKAAAQQRAEYNASLEDRSITVLQANPPHRIVYGRCIVGGDIVAIFTSDKTGTREDGSTYTKPDALKHLVIVVAAHEVQAINDIFIDGVSLGTLDGSGWVTAGEFYRSSQPAVRYASVPAASYVDVSPAVVAVVNSYTSIGTGLDAVYSYSAVTLSNGNTRISNAAATAVEVMYTVSTNSASVRVSKFLGTAGQTVDTYLNSVVPSQWTSNHRLRGLAGVVVTLDLEEPRFQAGPPQLTFDVSGKKVYDTRTSSTGWSENPALIIRDFLTSAAGFGVNASEIDVTACNAAANACDVRLSAAVQSYSATFAVNASTDQIECAEPRLFAPGDGVRLTTTGTLPGGLATATTYYIISWHSRTTFQLATSHANALAGTPIDITSAGTGTHTLQWHDYLAYTCNGAFATDGSGKEAVLEDLAETMAGTVTYGATWMIQAGAWVASVMSLTDDDLDGQIEIVQAGAGMDAIINGVRGQYIPTGKSAPVDMQPYQNATFLAADGVALWEDVSLPFVGNKVRAANLARIKVEQARDGLVIRYPAKLKAWPLQIGDRVAVTSTEYGWSAKTFRVTDWQFGTTTAVVLTLQEDAAAIYDLADAVSLDPAPNTGLPSPWTVASLTSVTATSGVNTVLKSGSNPMVPRVLVQWAAVTDPYVADGSGSIVVRWRRPGSTAWQQTQVPGDSRNAYITGVNHADLLTIEVYARNSLGQRGPATYIAHTVDGSAALDWASLTARPSDGELLNAYAGANFYWPVGQQSVPGGTYGTTLRTFRSGGADVGGYGLQLGETLTLSADMWADASTLAAGQYAALFLYSAQSGGAWIAICQVQGLSTTPTRVSASVNLPASLSDMSTVALGLYHQGTNAGTSPTGTVYADRIQVERGAVATQYQPAVPLGSVNTGELAAEAATVVDVTTVSSFTVNAYAQSPDNFTTQDKVASVTLTPSPGDAGNIDVLVTAIFEFTLTGAVSVAYAGLHDATYSASRLRMVGYASSTTTDQRNVMLSETFSIDANTSTEFSLYARKLGATNTYTMANVALRVEVIRR